MPGIGEVVAANLNQMVAAEQRGQPMQGGAQYQHSDFQRIPGTAGRYRNRQTGEEVSRRQHDKLIGRPLPRRTRGEARRRVAERIRRQGLKVISFAGIVRTMSGRDRREERYRQMRDETPIYPEALEQMLALWLAGDEERMGLAFNDAFVSAWWNGGAGEIADVDELDFDFGDEEDFG